jgi:transcriptional regulator with XRE-family HTH domain
MKETFGEYIHKLRIENNLTLTKLAAALDIDQSTLSKMENQKRNVTEDIIPKLADIFSLDVIQLEKEFLSEKIAELIYQKDNTADLLSLAKEKADYYKITKATQGLLNFSK